MLNDKSVSELISRSLSGHLDSTDQKAVDERLADDAKCRNFARLSKLIQDSLSDVAEKTLQGDTSVTAGLSAVAKSKLKQKLRKESARLSQMQLSATMVPDRTDTPVHGMGVAEDKRRAATDPADILSPKEGDLRKMSSRFSLIRKLGEGGLGTVWLARDEKLKRTVAIKEMNAAAAEHPRAWQRFHREAEITGHLEHPNIVPMYQFGHDAEHGQPFYAMRFVGKRTLVEAIEEYHDRREMGEDVTMDLHRLLSAFIGICQAIAYAHSRGVIHRDLKPENVALDNFGQVIVLDWGLAKISDEFESESILSGDSPLSDSSFGQTMAGEFIGTPLYMAPEQASGQLDMVDYRTDVYGLGAILFAMLTGSAPHQNSSVKEGSAVPIPELLESVAQRPSPRVRDYLPGVPSDLANICQKAMHPKRHSRYQSATEVADSVQRWMAGRSNRRQAYANSRGEGREMRTAMQGAVRDLERNVRFMSSLPPIQGLINAAQNDPPEDLTVWRERLGVIFGGLLKTNCDFGSVSFAKVSDGKFQELVRMERHRTDAYNIRSIPASRLGSGPLTTCMEKALSGHPDEVHVALSSECPDERRRPADGHGGNRLAAAVPIFDAKSEELFGFVMIEACLERLIETLLRERVRSPGRLFVLDNECRILIQINSKHGRVRDDDGKAMSSMSDHWETILPTLKDRGEYVDEQDHAVYATRIDLVPGRYSLAIAMCLAVPE